MFCKYCGKEISDDSCFCKYCGKSVKESVMTIIRVSVERRTGIFDVAVPLDTTMFNLKMLIASKISGDVNGMGSKLILDRTNEEVSEHYVHLADIDLKDDDIFIFVPKYIERTIVRRGGFGDMRCLYGCPMAKSTLTEAENYTDEDSIIE